MTKPILAFDLDGVLVDVTESYRETIARTVAHFTGQPVSHAEIQDYKNRGDASNDWLLTEKIVNERGFEAPFEEVKARFQELFLGNGTDGLIQRERWIPAPGLLEGLSERFRLAVFTARPREEANITLARFASGIAFDPIVAMEDVRNQKPAPDGLYRIFGAVRAPGGLLYWRLAGRRLRGAGCRHTLRGSGGARESALYRPHLSVPGSRRLRDYRRC